MWNNNSKKCEIPRKIEITNIKFEFNEKKPNSVFGPVDKTFCCPNRPDSIGVKATFTIVDRGRLEEKFKICSGFSQEKRIDNFGSLAPGPWAQEFCKSLTLQPGTPQTFSFHWSCVRTNAGYCPVVLTSIDKITYEDAGGTSPYFYIEYTPDNTGVPATAQKASYQYIHCDTRSMACEKTTASAVPSLLPVYGGIEAAGSHNALCGGTKLPETIVIPPYIPTTCDPFA
jgi:hypothetical protein